MSAPSMPCSLVGLVAAALTGALSWVPQIAWAESTPAPTPTPEVSIAATASATPGLAEKTLSPSVTESSGVPTGRTPAETELPTPATEAETPTTDASPGEIESEAGRTGLNDAHRGAAQAGAEVPAAEEQVQAQIEGSELTLVKTASPTRVLRVGQVVTYSFAATNNLTVDVNEVDITDELEGLSALTCSQPEPATLRPGEVLRCSATLTITQSDLDFGDLYNSANVFGEVAGGDPENRVDDVGAVDDAVVRVDQRPSIDLDASVSPTGTVDAGDRLRYRATATNTGNVTLRGARITSSLDALDLDCDPSARATLSPGESISCTGSYRVSDANARRGRVSNELTARATGPYDNQRVSDDVTLRVRVTKPVSTSDPGLADTGGPGGTLPVGVLGAAALIAGAGLFRRGWRS